MTGFTTFFPHVLRKIDRVHYGLLQPEELARALELDPNMPESRKLVAVPFVGKDVPSRASEFSHPDIVIGLSIAAYRYEGMRFTDFQQVLSELRARMETESGPYRSAKTTLIYNEWVNMAGGRVRGTALDIHPADRIFGMRKAADGSLNKTSEDLLAMQEDHLERVVIQTKIAARPSEELFQDIWPLHLIDLADPEQMGVLFRLLRHSPLVVEHYVFHNLFSRKHAAIKVSSFQHVAKHLEAPCYLTSAWDSVVPHLISFLWSSVSVTTRRVVTPKSSISYRSACNFAEVLPADWSVTQILDHVAGANTAPGKVFTLPCAD